MQGNKTINEILNDLKKYTDRMVMRPDEYTFRRRFISALWELLRQEVLKQGLNPEKSTISQRFLGLVQYLAHYMPDVTAFTTPLSGCARNNRPFIWTLLPDKCFESIKLLACRAPILKPIDTNNPDPLPMAPSREWEPSMEKAKSGRIAAQLASCQRSLVMHNITTKHTSMRWQLCSKPSWNGRTNY